MWSGSMVFYRKQSLPLLFLPFLFLTHVHRTFAIPKFSNYSINPDFSMLAGKSKHFLRTSVMALRAGVCFGCGCPMFNPNGP